MRVCLPDLADTLPAGLIGLILAPRARSADAKSNSAFFDIHLRYGPVSPGACRHDVVTSFSGSVTSSFGGALGSQHRLCRNGLGDDASDHGTWWIALDQLCQRWTSWMDSKSYCYKLTQTGSSVRWIRNDGRSGTARIGG